MSHINTIKTETSVNFLASAVGLARKTTTILQEGVEADQYGYKIVPAGTIIPANNGEAKGILFEPVDVTEGDHEGSIIVAGRIYKDCLPVAPAAAALSTLKASGIVFVDSNDTERPDPAEYVEPTEDTTEDTTDN